MLQENNHDLGKYNCYNNEINKCYVEILDSRTNYNLSNTKHRGGGNVFMWKISTNTKAVIFI